MSETFIVDEWLWADLNGEKKQEEAFQFLQTLYRKCDKIAVAPDTKFERKAKVFCRNQDDVKKRGIARYYMKIIRLNSAKCLETEIEEGTGEIEEVKEDDAYLLQIQKKTGGKIITTDNKLVKAIRSKRIPCELRDEFLKRYL